MSSHFIPFAELKQLNCNLNYHFSAQISDAFWHLKCDFWKCVFADFLTSFVIQHISLQIYFGMWYKSISLCYLWIQQGVNMFLFQCTYFLLSYTYIDYSLYVAYFSLNTFSNRQWLANTMDEYPVHVIEILTNQKNNMQHNGNTIVCPFNNWNCLLKIFLQVTTSMIWKYFLKKTLSNWGFYNYHHMQSVHFCKNYILEFRSIEYYKHQLVECYTL